MRQCLFCHREPHSREHVWPAWILKNLKEKRKPIKGFVGKKHFGILGNNPELKTKSVCGTCNEGWMHNLEVVNRHQIGPLMNDIALWIDPLEQANIAAWAIKTTIVALSMDRRHKKPFYSKVECEQLRSSLGVPVLTKVWLARYSGDNHLGLYGSYFWEGGKPDDPETIPGFCGTIFVGNLALQVLTLRKPEKVTRPVRVAPVPGPWARLLIQVWPTERKIQWPPPYSFSDGHPFPFPALIKRFSMGEPIEP
jgi:hypothetical protein